MKLSDLELGRLRSGICIRCGEEAVRPGKKLGIACAQRSAIRLARREAARRPQRPGLRVPKRCDICCQPGHTAKTCDVKPAARPRQCLRCFSMAMPGELICAEHKRTLEELEREGWREE